MDLQYKALLGISARNHTIEKSGRTDTHKALNSSKPDAADQHIRSHKLGSLFGRRLTFQL